MIDLFAVAFTAVVMVMVPLACGAYLYGCRVGRARTTEATSLRMRGRCASCGAETVLTDVKLERKTIAVDPGQQLVRPAEQDATFRRRRARA